MFGQTFYFGLIRKYVVLVGTLFNDINIIRVNADGDRTQVIKVPITYGPKDKMLARVLEDPDIDRPNAVPAMPMISFEMGKMTYNGDRKINTLGRSTVKSNTDASKFRYQYNPVPYDIDFEVSIAVKNTEDGTKIIEQILPYFTPDWTTTVSLIPEMEEIRDIPVVLRDISCEDKYTADFKERRVIIWTLKLTLMGYIYGPVKSTGIIKFTNTTFYMPSVADLNDAVGVTPGVERVTVQPGLTANGEPTSNIALTIPYRDIEATDNYGYIVQIESLDE